MTHRLSCSLVQPCGANWNSSLRSTTAPRLFKKCVLHKHQSRTIRNEGVCTLAAHSTSTGHCPNCLAMLCKQHCWTCQERPPVTFSILLPAPGRSLFPQEVSGLGLGRCPRIFTVTMDSVADAEASLGGRFRRVLRLRFWTLWTLVGVELAFMSASLDPRAFALGLPQHWSLQLL